MESSAYNFRHLMTREISHRPAFFQSFHLYSRYPSSSACRAPPCSDGTLALHLLVIMTIELAQGCGRVPGCHSYTIQINSTLILHQSAVNHVFSQLSLPFVWMPKMPTAIPTHCG